MDKLTNLEHLRAASLAAKGLIGEVAEATAEALEELAAQQQGSIPVGGGGGIPSGLVAMWSGAADAVPDGWALCDGENGTPDLRGRFVLGQSPTYAVGDAGGEETHLLAESEMPEHSHVERAVYNNSVCAAFAVPSNSVTYTVSGASTTAGYGQTLEAANFGAGADSSAFKMARGNKALTTYDAGSGAAHNNMPPYYVLCYIMKL